MLTLLAALVSLHPSLAQTTADPMQLPAAARQVPNWDAYEALNQGLGVRNAPYNFRYPDPATGVMVTKVTSVAVPLANASVVNDYSEGGPFISMEWGNGQHTILVRPASADRPWLADYQRGVGATNWRSFPVALPLEQRYSFSNVATTARILFYGGNDANGHARLYRLNTATNPMLLEGDGGNIPPEGYEVRDRFNNPLVGGVLHWMQSSKDDVWFAFMWCPLYTDDPNHSCVPTKVFAYNRLTNVLRERNCDDPDPTKRTFACWDITGPIGLPDGRPDLSDLNEPHLDRDGGYVQLLDGWRDDPLIPGDSGPPTCAQGGPGRVADERYWHFWDLATNLPTLPCKGFIRPEGIYTGHPAWVRGHFVSADPNEQAHWNLYYDRLNDSVTNTVPYADPKAFIPSHHSGQWIQAAADTTQWYWGSNYDDGEATATGWALYSGQIHRSGINWGPIYQKPVIGIRAVYQTAMGDLNRLSHTLTAASSVAAMAEGTFFHDVGVPGDVADDQLYVWAKDGGDPTGRMYFFAPTPVHRGVGVRRVNGTDVRLLAHNYSWPVEYHDIPFATTSPDGKLVMFTSNMGKKAGTDRRTDVFIAEVPLTVGGGGGCESGSAITDGPPRCQ
jgi:hypothetical protein